MYFIFISYTSIFEFKNRTDRTKKIIASRSGVFIGVSPKPVCMRVCEAYFIFGQSYKRDHKENCKSINLFMSDKKATENRQNRHNVRKTKEKET